MLACISSHQRGRHHNIPLGNLVHFAISVRATDTAGKHVPRLGLGAGRREWCDVDSGSILDRSIDRAVERSLSLGHILSKGLYGQVKTSSPVPELVRNVLLQLRNRAEYPMSKQVVAPEDLNSPLDRNTMIDQNRRLLRQSVCLDTSFDHISRLSCTDKCSPDSVHGHHFVHKLQGVITDDGPSNGAPEPGHHSLRRRIRGFALQQSVHGVAAMKLNLVGMLLKVDDDTRKKSN
jgi:hypothetical protein